MKLLLDTHIYIAMLKSQPEQFGKQIGALLNASENELFLSAATLWEMSIKWRLGKLDILQPPELLPTLAREFGMKIVAVNERHAIAHSEPEPPTRDPFDRLLLAQCAVEGMKLVTIDAALAGHPLSATAD
ncbi:type II toxin-antitoxin system VapC family toxin [Rhizobium herbae]|uniref:Type II toxin-antitoxin system VapC family toxin n=1 Tax=Rhizobium herbae TaxID=508661 RepID=A0ABS7H668_9HYPH|nr:type II toxin-antitoxin system VapC family toxin [Rhizobium herbae]MBW9062737.1 type II toxin-antitoxin system VapC family toxin [Rhizobium herbae]